MTSLSEADRETLLGGRLLIRSENEGDQGQASCVGLIDAPVEVVWDVISDYDGYPDFMPHVVESTVDAVDGQTVTATSVLKILVKRIRYTIRLTLDEAGRRIEWTQVEGDLKANDGSWVLEPFEGNRTLATYGLRIEVGYLIPQAVVDKLTKGSFQALFKAIRERSALFAHDA